MIKKSLCFNLLGLSGRSSPTGYRVIDGDFTNRINGYGTGAGYSAAANAFVVQPDRKIIAAGSMTSINGTSQLGRVTRMNADGSLDSAFQTNVGTPNVGAGFNNIACSGWGMALQPDGKTLYAGSATAYNGTAVKYLVRLNADGSLDTAFKTAQGTGTNSGTGLQSLALQPDGKIIVGGNGSTTSWNGTTVGNVVRLNPDGSLDTAFNTAMGTGATTGTIQSITIQSDGKIILCGGFTTFSGNANAKYIVRLLSTGAVDTAFVTALGTGFSTNTIVCRQQTDGKFVVAGSFTQYQGNAASKSFCRLNADLTLDTAFQTAQGTGFAGVLSPSQVQIQSDGRIICTGSFTSFNGNTSAKGVCRLLSNGSLDTWFASACGTNISGGTTTGLAIQPDDGKILIGGQYTNFNGNTAVHVIMRLFKDPYPIYT